MEPIDRVFYHELGHVIAQEIGRRHYGGSGVNEVIFYPCTENSEIYCGHITPVVPAGANNVEPAPLERMPRYLASIMYGCIFQDYYHGSEEFGRCLEVNGITDFDSWKGSLIFHKKFHLREEFMKIEGVFYKKLFKERLLENFIHIDPNYYLVLRDDLIFQMELNKIIEDLNEPIEEHYPVFDELVASYSVLLEV